MRFRLFPARTCGNCLRWSRAEGTGEIIAGHCFGAPPSVLTRHSNGTQTVVDVQYPIMNGSWQGCGVHRHRFGLYALIWRLTGGYVGPR